MIGPRRRGLERLAPRPLPERAEADEGGLGRIVGLEHRYTVAADLPGQRPVSADEAATFLFRPVLAWAGGPDAYVSNGGRLSRPSHGVVEYATPECNGLVQVVTYAKAGQAVLGELVRVQEERLRQRGVEGRITLFHDTSAAGGCHESYLSSHHIDPLIPTALVPYLVTRQLFAGSGAVLPTATGAAWVLSPRAAHVEEVFGPPAWDRVAIVDPDAAPLADERRYRRIHVVGGDGNQVETTTFLKVGATALVLRLLEERPASVPDLSLEDPAGAVREVSSDPSGRRLVRLASGRQVTSLNVQAIFLDAVHQLVESEGAGPEEREALRLWGECLMGLETDAPALSRSVDWMAKWAAIEAGPSSLHDPAAAEVDRAWGGVHPEGLFATIQASGAVDRMCSDDEVRTAGPPTNRAPTDTRARLRSEFLRKCRANGRDHAVDWTGLALSGHDGQAVVLGDPFASHDAQVDRLLAEAEATASP